MTRTRRLTFLLAAAVLAAGVALAQDGGEDRSRFVLMLEGMISTPDRQVSLTGLEGAFSSNPTVARITVADREGVWLEIEGVDVVWNRTALFRRTLDIDTLKASRVTLLRKPVAAEQPSTQGSGGAASMPVDIIVDSIDLPEIALAAPVAGAAAQLSATGSARLTADVIAAQISAERKDRPGTLSADLRLQPNENALTAELKLSEPEGGLLADMLALRGRPAVAISLDGEGPLASWQANLEMQAGGARVLAGGVGVSREGAAYRLSGDLAAALEPVVPEAYAALLSGDSRLAFNVLRNDAGAITVQTATLRSDGVDLMMSGALTSDFVPANAEISLKLGQAGRTTLPFVPGGLSVASLDLNAGLDAAADAPWRADVSAMGVESAFGAVGSLTLTASGLARDLVVPERRSATFRIAGTAGEVRPSDPALAAALGPTVRLMGSGGWSAGQPVAVEDLQLVLTGATVSFSGMARPEGLDGRFGASVTDLARFSGLGGRALGGSAQLQATGRVGLAGGALDLQLDGEATDLALGIAALDPVLAGTTRLKGGIARSGPALTFNRLALSNPNASAEISGSLSEPSLDLSVAASVADLGSLTPRAKGEARATVRVTGSTAAPEIDAEVSGDEIVLMDKPFTNASARFRGTVAGPQTSGDASLSGSLGGVPVKGAARLSAGAAGARNVDNLLFSVGQSRASGALSIGADSLLSGQLSVVLPDLAQVAPLFLVNASGMLKADVTLSAAGGSQAARFSGTATDIAYETVRLQSGEISGEALDLFGSPRIDGSFSVSNLQTGGLTVVSATGTAQRQGQATGFSVDARLSDGSASLTGSLEPRGAGMAIALQRLGYTRPGVNLALAAPTTILVQDGAARFEATRITANGGHVQLAGRAGSTLDLTAELSALPAAVANTFVPNLGAEGSISGSARVTGSAAAPAARFNLTWQGASVAASRNAGLGALAVTAEGTLADKKLDLNSAISGADGLSVRVAGSVGTAAGAPLALTVTGGVPLSLGNRPLADRGAALQGALNLDIRIAGTAAAPQFSGRITSEGGGFIDPATGIVLRNLSLAASLSNNRIIIDRLTAQSGEGTVSASGSIGLDAGFPVDLRATIRRARYVDGTLLATLFDADLTMTGSFAAGPVIGGSVTLDKTEITVPESLPRNSIAVNVKHIDTPPDVQRTLELARAQGAGRDSGGGSSPIRLDIRISAPRQIFVRGRGLDTELGGDLRLTGPVTAIVADGAFQMRRGRLDIFTQRITFNRGILTFAGDLDPILDFSGSTASRSITVTVTVTGHASDPQVNFSSIPELPQDEVLAHLIFNRGIADLSPVQIARLASAAVALSGGSGGGMLDRLRASTGLDDLDIVTDDEGAPALAAGRYISENVYLGVQQGATAESTKVTIDLDITEDVKARAAVSPQGDSSVGIFFEREY